MFNEEVLGLEMIQDNSGTGSLLHQGDTFHSGLESAIEAVVLWTFEVLGQTSFTRVLNEYMNRASKVHDDEEIYDRYMAYTLNCLIFEEPLFNLGSLSITPHRLFASLHLQQKPGLSDIEFVHSLFQVSAKTKSGIVVKDLIHYEKFHIIENRRKDFINIRKNDVIQNFLFRSDNHWVLNSNTILHPQHKIQEIRSFLKKSKSFQLSKKATLLKCLRAYTDMSRYHLRNRKAKPSSYFRD